MEKKEQTEKEYEELYMVNGNRKESIDYDILVKTYISYLSTFLFGPGEYKNFKGNISFLYDIINGFNYYQSDLFDCSFVDDVTLVNYINSKSMELLVNPDDDKEEDQLPNDVYKITYSCHNLVNESNHPFAPMIIRQMFSNACNIDATYNKYKGNYKGM